MGEEMELTKNIFFNTDKLLQNSKVKISYVGKLFENNSEEVYIHMGFGTFWDNLSEVKMENQHSIPSLSLPALLRQIFIFN